MRYGFGVKVLAVLFVPLQTMSLSAQSRADGALSARWLNADPSPTEAYYGDFTLGANKGAWEAQLGFFGAVGRLHESYADISYVGGATRLTLGFPRPAYDQVANAALTRIMPRFALESVGVSRSRATFGTMSERKFLPYGAVVAWQSGGIRAAASLHGVPDYDVTIAGGAFAVDLGAWQASAALEAVDQYGAYDWNVKSRAEYRGENWMAGAGVYLPRANGQAVVMEVFGSYAASPDAALTVLSRFTEGAGTLFGAGADIAMTRAVDLELGLVVDKSGPAAFEVGVSLNF